MYQIYLLFDIIFIAEAKQEIRTRAFPIICRVDLLIDVLCLHVSRFFSFNVPNRKVSLFWDIYFWSYVRLSVYRLLTKNKHSVSGI